MESKLYKIPTISYTIGKKRGLIIDSLNDIYYIVPNDLIKFIRRYNSWEMSKIKERERENLEVVDEYVSFLTKIKSILWLQPKHFDRFVKNYNYESNIPRGVHLDDKLQFIDHAANVCLSINRRLYTIKKLFYLPYSVKIHFFKTFILPYFDYFISLTQPSEN